MHEYEAHMRLKSSRTIDSRGEATGESARPGHTRTLATMSRAVAAYTHLLKSQNENHNRECI